jgi:hypothetical protein
MGMQAAVTRRDREGHLIAPEQAITARDALAGYTTGGAVVTAQEGQLGVIAPGAWADLAVLSDDPLAIAPDRLSTITVDQTWLAGELVYERT